ncbi:MAG TPA: hypothetical protein ENN92_01315 [candidate division WWE3 bacterium]|uniref:LPXTG cell wall anchor domain-containing protein n=1 Tax=candidate division WWE3 bacterium TaxID=2053526 RepID=A0A7C1DPA1_UNCKA|nr:hypothetical protein [candidate division WWE3 bacterium]
MKKTCLFLLALLITLNTSSVFAATFTLDKIGTLVTNGQRYTEWWYSGSTPALSGTSAAGTEVTVAFDDASSTVTTGTDGNWTHTPASLETGDYAVVISTDTDSYSFTLHLGQTMPTGGTTGSVSETTQSTVPDTGVAQVFAILGGGTALVVGWYLLSNKKDSAFLE